MQNFYNSEQNGEYPLLYKKIFQNLNDDFHRTSFETIRGDRSKLKTYPLFKTSIGLETYITETSSTPDRIVVTKLRLSNHRLMIEAGRPDHIAREQRYCSFCSHVVENESHFMFTCSTYSHLRTRYLRPITTNICNYQFLPYDAKMQILLSTMEQGTVKYIANSMELKQFLVSKPK